MGRWCLVHKRSHLFCILQFSNLGSEISEALSSQLSNDVIAQPHHLVGASWLSGPLTLKTLGWPCDRFRSSSIHQLSVNLVCDVGSGACSRLGKIDHLSLLCSHGDKEEKNREHQNSNVSHTQRASSGCKK